MAHESAQFGQVQGVQIPAADSTLISSLATEALRGCTVGSITNSDMLQSLGARKIPERYGSPDDNRLTFDRQDTTRTMKDEKPVNR